MPQSAPDAVLFIRGSVHSAPPPAPQKESLSPWASCCEFFKVLSTPVLVPTRDSVRQVEGRGGFKLKGTVEAFCPSLD